MQAFRDLSSVGKIRRLRSLARDALEKKFGITNASLSLLSTHSFNTIFRVDCEDGQRYALRVGDEIRIHTRGVETIEAEWLDSLGTITPMRSVPTIAGKFGETIENAMVDGQRVVSLLTWVPGSDLRHRFWSDAAAHAGRLLAELHRQSQTPQPATQVRLIRADVPITFGDRTLLGKWQSPHGSLFAEAIHRAQIGLDQLWASPPH